MQSVDLLIAARWVLPIAPQNIVLDHYAIAVQNQRIVGLMPINQAKEHFYAEQYIELPNHVVMPGLVNAHAHTPMTLFRGLADDLPLMDWLNQHIWPAERALINQESVAVGSRLAIAEMLRSGTTCFNDNYFFPNITAKVAIEEGIRACLGHVIMSVPTGWAEDEEGYFSQAQQILNQHEDHPLITWSIAPHAPYTVSDRSFQRAQALAEHYDLPIHLHLHETKFEVEDSIKTQGRRPFQRLQELGLITKRLIAVHMTQLTSQEMTTLADTGGHIVHCPESNLKLASGFAPVNEMINNHLNVAIGTDGAASNNDLDMFGELRTAALTAKAVSNDPTVLPVQEVLKMATLNGARALGLGDQIGSIEKNKAADIIAVDLSHYSTQPVYNPLSHLVFAIDRSQVSDVWVAGKRLLKNKSLTQLNTESLAQQAQHWAKQALPYRHSCLDQEVA